MRDNYLNQFNVLYMITLKINPFIFVLQFILFTFI